MLERPAEPKTRVREAAGRAAEVKTRVRTSPERPAEPKTRALNRDGPFCPRFAAAPGAGIFGNFLPPGALEAGVHLGEEVAGQRAVSAHSSAARYSLTPS
jgi:hypothetical protein